MTAFLDFTVPREAFVLGRVLDVDHVGYVELTQFVPTGESLVPFFWAETDDAEAFEAAVTESPQVDELIGLNGVTGQTLYRVEWTSGVDGLLDALQAHDVAVLHASTDGGDWTFRTVAADRETFTRFQTACREKDLPIDVRRLSNSKNRERALYGLTDKQREALLLAYQAGYFEPGTDVRLGDISGELEISQQALGGRLKRGTRALISNTIALGHT
ncbi:bacterio-opsin activator HTH domain-containing protein [Halogeometricum pallidum JCM 14848]|uniref:Bacterio-opsin activator HTH domain-containing protein n=1 Tax=Halogeometricum pallidum JCM 14848 TaxID=1227487 RepID=M0D4T9_HALPD|nr:helix-turn-helix domain-containing protein [Halogeometricum pallidum]ELZ30465.1 bacterio-opsin activator HTH domain-containing protein [Halogeometricum pallidum JCM 14848]